MDITIWISNMIAVVALLLSVFATWKTVKFNEYQKSLIKSQNLLNRRLLEKEETEATSAQKANLDADFQNLGSHRYCLKISNKGKATARNVRIDFPDNDHPINKWEIDEKLPLESLEQHQSVELATSVDMDTKRKHHFILIWDDDAGPNHSKDVHPTL